MKAKTLTTLTFCLLLPLAAQAYDGELAAKLDNFYTKLNHQALAKSKLIISADDLYKEGIDKKVPYMILDVRTDAEAGMVNYAMPNSMHISLDTLFRKENLDTLPKEKKIVVACHSGVRSLLAAVNLKMLGFKDVHSR